jgi:hypothetical protein
MDRNEALDALERAEAVGARVRGQGGSYLVYAAGYAALSFGLVLALGLLPSPAVTITATAVFVVGAAALVGYQIRRPVTPRGFGWLHGSAMAAWGVLYAVTLAAGYAWFPGEPAWWIPAAVVCALPLLVAGFVVRGRARRAA